MVVDSVRVSPQIDMENDIPNQSRNEQINAKDLSPINHKKTKKNKEKVSAIFIKFNFGNVEQVVDLLLQCFCRAKSNRPHQSPRPL
jgi:hypothetical protein